MRAMPRANPRCDGMTSLQRPDQAAPLAEARGRRPLAGVAAARQDRPWRGRIPFELRSEPSAGRLARASVPSRWRRPLGAPPAVERAPRWLPKATRLARAPEVAVEARRSGGPHRGVVRGQSGVGSKETTGCAPAVRLERENPRSAAMSSGGCIARQSEEKGARGGPTPKAQRAGVGSPAQARPSEPSGSGVRGLDASLGRKALKGKGTP